MLDWLYGLQSIGIKLGLENMRRLLAELPTPRTPPLTIHVAGTNGKGSVCAFMDAIARAHGLKTGLFTSPHLVRFQERIRVNGETIPDKDMDRWLSHLREIVSDWDPHPSFFEITLALAIAHFYEQQIECLLLETGLGGRLDATNALEPRHVSVITPIHYDHTHILGKTLDAIAREKAGIFRAGIPIVSALQLPEAERALKQSADAIQAPIRFVRAPYEGKLSLAGQHQRDNAALAIAVFESANQPISDAHIEQGLQKTMWMGRFQRIGTRYVIDGAHNIASIAALVETWRQQFGSTKATIIFGCANDKPLSETLPALDSIAERFIFTAIQSPRSESPDTLASLAERQSHSVTKLSEALALSEEFPETVLITGSLFLAGEAIAHLTQETPPLPSTQ